jgi:hypothetical protein
MQNPFAGIKVKPEAELDEQQQKMEKREVFYRQYDPLVKDVLGLFIAEHRPGMWEIDSDCTRLYCCHIAWFAGPKEKLTDPYDQHHTLRRRIEVKLEMDGLCNPTGFQVTSYEAIVKNIHVGLEKEELVRGIKAVME